VEFTEVKDEISPVGFLNLSKTLLLIFGEDIASDINSKN